MKVNDVRAYIAQMSLDHVRYGSGSFIFNTFTGSGKTTTVLKTIYESEDGLTWMYFAPYHKIIEENIELSKVIDFHHFIHLESRAKLCLSKEHRKLANEGINITPFCENFCILKTKRCPYYENLRMVREMPTCLAGVHAHIPTLMQTLLWEKWEGKCLYNYYDVIVIDEFPSSTIYNQIGVAKHDIDRARDILELTNINTNEAHLLRLILDEMSLATGSISLNYAKVFSMFSKHKGLNFDGFREEYDGRILGLITKGRIKSPPKDVIHYLIEIYKARPNIIDLKWMIYKSEYNQWHKGKLFLTFSNLSAFQNLPCKIIALDGTADLETWRAVLGDPCEILSFDIEYKDAFQLLGARNPTSTIVKKGNLSPSGLKMFELLKAICNYKKQKVLICATKRIQSLLKKHLKKNKIKNYVFATYFNLRSRNSYYEDCDTCVIFHEPNIPPFQAEIIQHVLGWNNAIIKKIHREDEMRQALGRLRQNIPVTPRGRKRKEREIFVFSSTGYKRLLPAAKYMYYDDMLGYVKSGKKRVFFDVIDEYLSQNKLTKEMLRKSLGVSNTQINHIVNILEDEGIVKNEWGNLKYIKPIEDEEKFLISIGRGKS